MNFRWKLKCSIKVVYLNYISMNIFPETANFLQSVASVSDNIQIYFGENLSSSISLVVKEILSRKCSKFVFWSSRGLNMAEIEQFLKVSKCKITLFFCWKLFCQFVLALVVFAHNYAWWFMRSLSFRFNYAKRRMRDLRMAALVSRNH